VTALIAANFWWSDTLSINRSTDFSEHSNLSALGVEDQERAARAISRVVGKRLLYRDSSIN
jgi:hypothetical protein